MGQIKINKNLLVVTGCHIFGYYDGKFLQVGYLNKALGSYTRVIINGIISACKDI